MKWLQLFIKLIKQLFMKKEIKEDKKLTKEEIFKQHLHILSGFDLLIPYTHAYHESGAFQKVIGNYNFWGIKKPQKWTGKIIDITTHEYINDKKVKVIDAFIDFNVCSEALLWYENLIRRLYPESYKNRTDYKLYFEWLTAGKYKYATDKFYSAKLINLYEQLKDKVII